MSQLELSSSQQPVTGELLAIDVQRPLSLPFRLSLMLAVGTFGLLLSQFVPPRFIGMALVLMICLGVQLLTARFLLGIVFIGTVIGCRFFEYSTGDNLIIGLEAYFCFLVIGHLSLSSRYAQTLKYAKAYEVDSDEFSWMPRLGWVSTWFSTIPYAGFLAIGSGILLIWVMPRGREMIYQFGIQPNWGVLIFLTLILFFSWLFFRAVLGIVRRFQLSPEVADVSLRSTLGRDLWRDHAGVERRTAKLMVKQRAAEYD